MPPAPQKNNTRLRSAPKPRQVYWCLYPEDSIEPEFWKKRPVVVISRNATLRSAVSLLPFTTQAQPGNKWAIEIASPINGEDSWLICNQPITFSTGRLSQPGRKMVTLSEDIYGEAITLLHKHLITPRN